MNMMEIKQTIKEFLSGSFRVCNIKDTDNIFETGIVHSLFFIQLLVFIEKKFKIELNEEEFDIQKLTTIEAISHIIDKKLNPLEICIN